MKNLDDQVGEREELEYWTSLFGHKIKHNYDNIPHRDCF